VEMQRRLKRALDVFRRLLHAAQDSSERDESATLLVRLLKISRAGDCTGASNFVVNALTTGTVLPFGLHRRARPLGCQVFSGRHSIGRGAYMTLRAQEPPWRWPRGRALLGGQSRQAMPCPAPLRKPGR